MMRQGPMGTAFAQDLPAAPRRWHAGMAVLLAHLLLAWLLGQAMRGPSLERPDVALQHITLWLQPSTPMATQKPTKVTPPPAPPARSTGLPSVPEPLPDQAPADIPPHETPLVAPPAARPALNLSLPSQGPMQRPRHEAVNPALDDARGNTRPPTLEQRMAQAFGTDGAPEEERVSDTVRIFRKNGKCLIAEQSRAGQIFAIDQASRHIPWGVRPCT